MSAEYKAKVKEFFDEAAKVGYDTRKIRRVIESKLQALHNDDNDKFKEVAYAMVRNLNIKLPKKPVVSDEHL